MLNLYIFSDSTSPSGPASIAYKLSSPGFSGDRGGNELLRSMIIKTERLSPPVVGIMRRTVQDIILHSQHENNQDTLIPKGWDVWLYFVGASRDPVAHMDTAGSFLPARHINASNNQQAHSKPSFAFGAGPKSCLGEHLVWEIVTTVAKTCLGSDLITPSPKPMIELQRNGTDIPLGVQAWLGWQPNVKPEEWAKDMKQLPTQRPVKPVTVRVVYDLNSQA